MCASLCLPINKCREPKKFVENNHLSHICVFIKSIVKNVHYNSVPLMTILKSDFFYTSTKRIVNHVRSLLFLQDALVP